MARNPIELELLPHERAALLKWNFTPEVRDQLETCASSADVETITLMQTFPDDEAIARLRRLDVRYVLVHQSFYTPKSYTALMLRVLRRSDLVSHGRFRDWVGWTDLLELKSTDG